MKNKYLGITLYGLSQVFITIDLKKLHHFQSIQSIIDGIIKDYLQSVPFNENAAISYPGERVLQNRQRNLEFGIPVQESVWERILQL
jgi:3-dehydro-L-gulonate 2-dehydrogenase